MAFVASCDRHGNELLRIMLSMELANRTVASFQNIKINCGQMAIFEAAYGRYDHRNRFHFFAPDALNETGYLPKNTSERKQPSKQRNNYERIAEHRKTEQRRRGLDPHRVKPILWKSLCEQRDENKHSEVQIRFAQPRLRLWKQTFGHMKLSAKGGQSEASRKVKTHWLKATHLKQSWRSNGRKQFKKEGGFCYSDALPKDWSEVQRKQIELLCRQKEIQMSRVLPPRLQKRTERLRIELKAWVEEGKSLPERLGQSGNRLITLHRPPDDQPSLRPLKLPRPARGKANAKYKMARSRPLTRDKPAELFRSYR